MIRWAEHIAFMRIVNRISGEKEWRLWVGFIRLRIRFHGSRGIS
jgi:hypothetical protein